jgi:hypothetical protein
LRAELTGHDNYWIDASAAAVALGVTEAQVRVIAHRRKWRRTTSRPVQYLMADVRQTAQDRFNAKNDPRKGARPPGLDTPPFTGNTEGA